MENNNNLVSKQFLLEKMMRRGKVDTFAQLLVLSDTVFNRSYYLADVDDDTADSFFAFVRYWNDLDEEQKIPAEQRQPIKLFINSDGGSLSAAFTIIDCIKSSKTPVYTINTGSAYSAGFFIFITGAKRLSYPHSTFLFHEGSTGLHQIDAGKFRNYTEFYNKQVASLKDIVLENTKILEEEYEKHKLDDWWLTTEQSVEYGICDEIITEIL